MVARFIRIIIFLGLIIQIMVLNPFPVQAIPQPAAAVILLAPTACPSSGCAAGQRLNFKVEYDLGVYLETLSPNVQVCVYTPTNWSAYQFGISATGEVTGEIYTPENSNCSFDTVPAGYILIGGASATLTANSFGDALSFGLRIGGSASTSGSVLVRVLEQSGASTWVRSSQAFSSVRVTTTGTNVFVANDAVACVTNSPCYINSLDDLPDGVGTGLKDAIDARTASTTITILGNYLIKDQTVLIQQSHIIQGSSASSLTYSGSVCNQPMLKLTGGATLRNLIIRDGNCSTTSRDLVVVEGSSAAVIEYSTLTGGKDAIQVTGGNSGNLRVQFNQVTGNSGYAIWLGATNTGVLEAIGNNLYSNRTGAQVECNTHGRVDHNYWGAGVAASTSTNNCTMTDARRLGAPVLQNTSGQGVNGGKVNVVSTTKNYYANSVGFLRTGGTDFDVYVVNHGAGAAINVPFTSSSPSNLNPCSSYWDIFVAENTTLPADTILSIFLKYDLTSGCIATISSTRYCTQPEPADTIQYPLYWYDPATYPTVMEWKTTGSTGQATACQVVDDEIRVDIDATGRPNLTDLNFLPFVIGLPGQPTAVEIVDYGAIPGGKSTALIISFLTLSLLGAFGMLVWKERRHD